MLIFQEIILAVSFTGIASITIFAYLSYGHTKTKAKAKRAFITHFEDTLDKAHKMIHKSAEPENELEKQLKEALSTKLAKKTGGKRSPLAIKATIFLQNHFKPECDKYGLYYETTVGNRRIREYPLLENIYSRLDDNALGYKPIGDDWGDGFDTASEVVTPKAYKPKKSTTLQPRRPTSKPVSDRIQKLLPNQQMVATGTTIDF